MLAAARAALDAMRRGRDFGSGLAPRDAFGRHDEAALRHRLGNRQYGWQLFDRHHRPRGRFAGVQHVACNDHRHRLAQKLDLALSQKRVIVDDGSAIVLARNILGRIHRHHAVLRQNGRTVNALANELAVGHRRQNQGCVKGATQLGDVVGVDGLARDMQARGFVRQLFALGAGAQRTRGLQLVQWGGGVHANSFCVAAGAQSSTNCSTRLRATKLR